MSGVTGSQPVTNGLSARPALARKNRRAESPPLQVAHIVMRFGLLLVLVLATPIVAQDVLLPGGLPRDRRLLIPIRQIPFPSADARWIRIRSERFDILSSSSEARTRELVGDIETLAAALVGASERFSHSRIRATVFVFDRRRDSQPYFDLLFAQKSARAAGAYVRHDGGGVMIVDGSRKSGPLRRDDPGIRTAMHELIHDLLRQAQSAPPRWLEEGLAEYFSNARVTGSRVTAGEPIREHVALLEQRSLMTLDQLFAMKEASPDGSSQLFYAQSWAAVSWLISTDQNAFFAFLQDVEQGTAIADALQARYGKSLREMEAALRWRHPILRGVILQSGAAGFQPVTAAAQPLDFPTLLYKLGRFLSQIPGAREEAERHYREALRLDPKHARSLAALGQLDEAVVAAPNDPEVHLLYAENLLRRGNGRFAGIFNPTDADRERLRKARELAERALALGLENVDGGEGAARGIIGTAYLVEEDLSPGLALLQRAHMLVPRRVDFALNLYAMYLRLGDRSSADAFYAATFDRARDPQTVAAARNAIVISETWRANALAMNGKLDEAALIIRQLAATTPDPTRRHDLEQHAAKLEATSVVNREITSLNEAVTLMNRGHEREAIQKLDDLLKVATAESVIQDARKLLANWKK